MSFFITHRNQRNEHDPPLKGLRKLLAELAIEDTEPPEVSVVVPLYYLACLCSVIYFRRDLENMPHPAIL